MPPRRTLPPFEILVAHLNAGESTLSIGERYGLTKKAVANQLRRDAEARGIPWPLPGRENVRRKAKVRAEEKNVMNGEFIRASVIEAYEQAGRPPYREFAAQLGVDTMHAYRLVNRDKSTDRIKPRTARKLLTALGEPIPEWLEAA